MLQSQKHINEQQLIDKVSLAVKELRVLGFPLLNIRQALPKLTGISHVSLAHMTGIPRGTVTHILNYESGQIEAQSKIAEAYGVDRTLIFESDQCKKSAANE